MLVWVYTCQNVTLLEITCHCSYYTFFAVHRAHIVYSRLCIWFCVGLCFGMHYFMSFLVLQSSWRGRENWLLCFCLLDGMFCYCKWSVALPHGAVCWSAVCDPGISWSYSLCVPRSTRSIWWRVLLFNRDFLSSVDFLSYYFFPEHHQRNKQFGSRSGTQSHLAQDINRRQYTCYKCSRNRIQPKFASLIIWPVQKIHFFSRRNFKNVNRHMIFTMISLWFYELVSIKKVHVGMCAHQRLRSACALARSDLSLWWALYG